MVGLSSMDPNESVELARSPGMPTDRTPISGLSCRSPWSRRPNELWIALKFMEIPENGLVMAMSAQRMIESGERCNENNQSSMSSMWTTSEYYGESERIHLDGVSADMLSKKDEPGPDSRLAVLDQHNRRQR